MAKRKLSKRQRERIGRKQLEQLDGAATQSGENGLVVAHHGHLVDVEDAGGELHRCHFRANIDGLVCGDRVLWHHDDSSGAPVIAARQPRHTELCRPDPHGRLKTLAANIDRLVVVLAPEPAPSSLLLDRYLVAAELSGIHPLLVINKQDRIGENQRVELDSLSNIYQGIGYQVLKTSADCETGIETLRAALAGHTSVLAGQSGVGKSALANALLPGTELATGPVSGSGQGQHTTTAARLFHLPGSGQLIDSPGIREFGLWHISHTELLRGYVELAPLAAQCRFRNCTHGDEPGCALHQGVREGRIHPRRLKNFFRIAATLDPDRQGRY